MLIHFKNCQVFLDYSVCAISGNMHVLIPVPSFFNFRLIEFLRSKLSKTNEDLDTITTIETAIGKIQKNLHNFQSEVPALYVWGENPDTTEALLKVSI